MVCAEPDRPDHPPAHLGEREKRQLAILANRNAMTPTLLDEVARTSANFRAARSQAFPSDLPVLLLVVSEDAELADWVPLHEAQVAALDHGVVVPLAGGHYLNHTESTTIAAEMKRFLHH